MRTRCLAFALALIACKASSRPPPPVVAPPSKPASTSASLQVETIAKSRSIRLQPLVDGAPVALFDDGDDGASSYARIDLPPPLARTRIHDATNVDHLVGRFDGALYAALPIVTRTRMPVAASWMALQGPPAPQNTALDAWRDGVVLRVLPDGTERFLDGSAPRVSLQGLGCPDGTSSEVAFHGALVDRGFAFAVTPIEFPPCKTRPSGFLFRPGEDGVAITLPPTDSAPYFLSATHDGTAYLAFDETVYRVVGTNVESIELPHATTVNAMGATDGGSIYALVRRVNADGDPMLAVRVGGKWSFPAISGAPKGGAFAGLLVRDHDVWFVQSTSQGDVLLHVVDAP